MGEHNAVYLTDEQIAWLTNAVQEELEGVGEDLEPGEDEQYDFLVDMEEQLQSGELGRDN